MPTMKHFLEGTVHYPDGWKPDTELGPEQIKWCKDKFDKIFTQNVATLLDRDRFGRPLIQ